MKRSIFAFLIFSLFTGQVFAIKTPNSLEGVTIVNTMEVESKQKGGAIVVDARPKMEYLEGHIPGSVNIPYKDKGKKEAGWDASKDRFKIEKLSKAVGGDKSKAIIFYCNGIHCWQSPKAAIWSKKEGYKNVMWYRDGLPAWEKAGKKVIVGE